MRINCTHCNQEIPLEIEIELFRKSAYITIKTSTQEKTEKLDWEDI